MQLVSTTHFYFLTVWELVAVVAFVLFADLEADVFVVPDVCVVFKGTALEAFKFLSN